MKKLATVLGLLAMMVIVGVTAWWYFIASFGERQVRDFIARAADDGVTIAIARTERSGFPAQVRWRLEGVSIDHASGEGRLEGDMPGLEAVMDITDPQRVRYTLTAPSVWRWTPAGGGSVRTYTVQSGGGAVAPNKAAAGWRVTGALRQVDWTAGQAGASGAAESLAAEAVLPFDRRSAAFTVQAAGIELSQDQPLGRTVREVMVEGNAVPLPPDLTPAGLAAWRQAGGRLTITGSKIVYGPLNAGADGEMALDAGMRPVGRVNLTVADPQPLLDLAAREGWIQPDQLRYARMGMGMLSRRNSRGEQEFNTSLDMRDGVLWLGPLQLLPLPPVVRAP